MFINIILGFQQYLLSIKTEILRHKIIINANKLVCKDFLKDRFPGKYFCPNVYLLYSVHCKWIFHTLNTIGITVYCVLYSLYYLLCTVFYILCTFQCLLCNALSIISILYHIIHGLCILLRTW